MVRTRLRLLAIAMLGLAPLAVAGCGTPAAAATGAIVVEPANCLAGISPFLTITHDGRLLRTALVRVGSVQRFEVHPGIYVLSDTPLSERVQVHAGEVLHLSFLPECMPGMS